MPESLRKDGALYLPHCDPEVVRTLIHCLKRENYWSSDYEFDDNLRSQDPLFYIKTYKLALTLACVLTVHFCRSPLISVFMQRRIIIYGCIAKDEGSELRYADFHRHCRLG